MRISGLTLIEILVIFFIISIVASMSMLAINHHDNKAVESFVDEFTQRLSLAEEVALFNSVTLRLSMHEKTWQVTKFDNQKHRWEPIQVAQLKPQIVPEEVDVHFQNRANEQIVVSVNGDVTPFHLSVGKSGERPRYVVIGEGDGAIETKKLP